MQGVQPMANAMPATSAPPSDAGCERTCTRISRANRRPPTPISTRPMRMTSTPPTTSSVRRWSMTRPPNCAAPMPSAVKTMVKPATKNAVAIVTRRTFAPSSSYATPETYERYAGTSGHTQGEMNDRKPAVNAVARPTGERVMAASTGEPTRGARRRRSARPA